MLNYNFIRASAFTLIILLIFSVSVYDPSVYAKMQVMEDDHLAQIEGEAGVTLGLNLTVRSVANNISISNGTGAGMNDAINLGLPTSTSGSVFIGDGADPSLNFSVSTNIISDIGSSGGRTWLSTSGVMLPSSANGIGVKINQLNAKVDGTIYNLGPNCLSAPFNYPSLLITGIFMGQDVTSVGGIALTGIGTNGPTTLTGTSPMYTRIGAHDGSAGKRAGVSFYSEMATYIDHLRWDWGEGGYPDDQLNISGIYLYGYADTDIGANEELAPKSAGNDKWGTTVTGNMKIGHNGTAVDYATIDVGSNGSPSGTILRLSIPNSGNMRIKNFKMGSDDFGSIASEGQNFTRLIITVRNLNASGY
jgi:hypothetical protein